MLGAQTAPAGRLPPDRRRLGGPAPARAGDARGRRRARRAPHAARRPDLHRRRRDLADRRDRGVLRHRAGVLQPAYNGLVPRTVPPDEVQEAQALSSFTFNFAELTGPAIATALVLGLGAGWAFLLDAATFVVSALLLRACAPPARRPPPSERGRAGRAGRGLPRGALAAVAVGDGGGVRARRPARLRAAVRARPDDRQGDLRLAARCSASSPPPTAPARSPAR